MVDFDVLVAIFSQVPWAAVVWFAVRWVVKQLPINAALTLCVDEVSKRIGIRDLKAAGASKKQIRSFIEAHHKARMGRSP